MRLKRNVLRIIGIIIFIALVFGFSYSYFVYNKDIANVSIITGDISINLSSINGNLNLGSTLPKSDNEGINSNNYLDFTVNSKVDTEKIYYEVYILPRSGNTLNTDYLKLYLTDQTNNVLTNVTMYNSLVDSTVPNGKALYRDIVDLNNDYSSRSEVRTFRLRLWLDENYPELTTKTFNFDIYLYARNVSEDYQIVPPVCKRVTNVANLHTETCSQGSNYCYADGYYAGGAEHTTMITYGNAKAMDTSLTTGDAFDCDIDGSGYTERFYYVSDRWNTGTNINSFDSETAVLVYYQNFVSGEISSSGVAYHSNDNWHGPTISNFPSINGANDWKDTLLKLTTRTIYACNDANCSSVGLTTNNGSNTIANPFDYSDVSARMLSLPELIKGCKSVNNNTSLATNGSLKQCNFLFEGTKYSSSSNTITGIWLETPNLTSNNVMAIKLDNRKVESNTISNTFALRPVIEIAKEDMDY